MCSFLSQKSQHFCQRGMESKWEKPPSCMCVCAYALCILWYRKWQTKFVRFVIKHSFTACAFISGIVSAIGIDPINDFNMIGHKRWNIAFQNGCISLDYILIVHLGFVKLADHWIDIAERGAGGRIAHERYGTIQKHQHRPNQWTNNLNDAFECILMNMRK